jgi:hypothetical protein
MQECETGTDGSFLKRVSVRTGGAGHAHSGVVKADSSLTMKKSPSPREEASSKIVRLGR